MIIKKFNIYLADLNPGFGTEPGKLRPVIVVQTNLLNDVCHPSTIVCPITTKIVNAPDVIRQRLHKNVGGIKQDSDILLDQIRAIDNKRFKKHLGVLPNLEQRKLIENLHIIIQE